MFLSIITPTYNRGYILSKCYDSLVAQTCKDFEWIVVDDGSTDDTETLVQSFVLENKLDIKYVKKENGGKHLAHNVGAELAQGELFLCLDSDDLLTEDSVAFAKAFWEKNQGKNITGILAKRGSITAQAPICGTWKEGLKSATMFDLFNKYGFYGDTALFFRTEILKKEKFISFKGEKFIPETALYCEIDKYGEMLLVDKVLYLTEYLPDGLTAKYHTLLKNNPKGTSYTYYQQLCMAKDGKQKFKYAMLVNIYKSLCKEKSELQFTQEGFWLFITGLPALLYKKYFFNKLSKGMKNS